MKDKYMTTEMALWGCSVYEEPEKCCMFCGEYYPESQLIEININCHIHLACPICNEKWYTCTLCGEKIVTGEPFVKTEIGQYFHIGCFEEQ